MHHTYKQNDMQVIGYNDTMIVLDRHNFNAKKI